MRLFLPCALSLLATVALPAADTNLAAGATNQLGLDLRKQLGQPEENFCLSPYSIQAALAMTFAGADGETRAEMSRVLHYPDQGEAVHASFAALQKSLEQMAKETEKIAANSKKFGGPSEPITLAIANRLFAQNGYDFRDSFRTLATKFYGAGFELLDFRNNPERDRQHINSWIEEQTRRRIRDLIPPDGVNKSTRLVLANAIYLKAPWQSEFSDRATELKPFHVRGGEPVDVPTMREQATVGYARKSGFTAVTLPYAGRDLQLLVILPDENNGLAKLEDQLTASLLKDYARLDAQLVALDLPKFKLEPPTIFLSKALQGLGMKTAFDIPPQSANFDAMAARKPNDYLAISEVFHKTFIAIDEKGTEAAAATAVAMMAMAAAPRDQPKPIEVKVDRPFFYAIQHVPSGACLFIGRVTDPR